MVINNTCGNIICISTCILLSVFYRHLFLFPQALLHSSACNNCDLFICPVILVDVKKHVTQLFLLCIITFESSSGYNTNPNSVFKLNELKLSGIFCRPLFHRGLG